MVRVCKDSSAGNVSLPVQLSETLQSRNMLTSIHGVDAAEVPSTAEQW